MKLVHSAAIFDEEAPPRPLSVFTRLRASPPQDKTSPATPEFGRSAIEVEDAVQF